MTRGRIDMPSITILLFAHGRELVGDDHVILDIPAHATVADLRSLLVEQVPTLAALLERSAIAVNYDIADNSRTLSASDEVAVIPPVSGG